MTGDHMAKGADSARVSTVSAVALGAVVAVPLHIALGFLSSLISPPQGAQAGLCLLVGIVVGGLIWAGLIICRRRPLAVLSCALTLVLVSITAFVLFPPSPHLGVDNFFLINFIQMAAYTAFSPIVGFAVSGPALIALRRADTRLHD